MGPVPFNVLINDAAGSGAPSAALRMAPGCVVRLIRLGKGLRPPGRLGGGRVGTS